MAAIKGKFYIQDIRGTDRLGNFFTTRDQCESSVNSRVGTFGCYQSETLSGKAYIGEVSVTNTKLGNYFDNFDNCVSSLRAVSTDGSLPRDGFLVACYQSESFTGKWYLGGIDAANAKIGNYYNTFPDCIDAVTDRRNGVTCMPSESQSGKWFLADLRNNAALLGNYLNTRDECFGILRKR